MRTSNTGHPPSNLESKAHRHLDVGRSVFDVRCSPRAFTLVELPAARRSTPLTPGQRGFTLIELLVVITIIVVLLALLVPAMDKAIYQAELAVCAANLHAIGTGVTTYAMDHKRSYPYRAGVYVEGTNQQLGDTYLSTNAWHPHKLWNGGTDRNFDDRIKLRPYMGINGTLNDPLAKRADLDNAKNGSHTYATYYLWFGYRFLGHGGMTRVGSKLTWTDGDTGELWRFDVLAGDQDDCRPNDSTAATFAGHPDADGKLRSALYQDAGNPQSVVARWEAQGNIERGTMEMNFVFAGGDVSRTEKVALDDDPRMAKVPVYNNGNSTLLSWTHLPK